MTFIYYKDIFPIIISWFIFFLLAASHRILLPNQYGSFLQFKEEENTKKTVQSSSIRILYLIIGTLFLHLVLSFTKKQIIIGVFIVSVCLSFFAGNYFSNKENMENILLDEICGREGE